jgi:hypothetical protein
MAAAAWPVTVGPGRGRPGGGNATGFPGRRSESSCGGGRGPGHVAAMMPDGQEMNQDGMKVGSMFHFQACLQFIITDQ